MYIFLFKSRIKYPVYKYGRHWLSQPMRREAPIPYIRICPSTKSVQDTQIWMFFFFFLRKNARILFLFCHHRLIFWYTIGHCKSVFCNYMHNNLVGEKCTQANICNASYDQKSQPHMEVYFFLRVNENLMKLHFIFVCLKDNF